MTSPGPQGRRRIGWAVALAGGLVLALPGIALAHPLGNFTVNHYAGIRVEPDRIVLDVVIDEAEIPTFQDRLRIDTDGDGVISDDELNVERLAACAALVPDLALSVDGRRLALTVFDAGLSFPPGTAGLSTMRVVCELSADVPAATAWPARIGFDDTSHPGRIGWHEVVVSGSGVTLRPGSLPTKSISNRLRTYPPNLIPHPLNVQNVTFSAALGGSQTPFQLPSDALALTASPAEAAGDAPAETAPPSSPGPGGGTADQAGPGATAGPLAGPLGAPPGPSPAAVDPGGVGGIDIAGLVDSEALTPLVLLGALVAAFLLGAGHALTPGHGKTLMGAYLVGSRGTALQALALGLAVTVSHTLGIVVLAAIILQARSVAPELFNTVAPVVSGGAVIAIGSWLLLGQLRQYLARRRHRRAAHGPDDGDQPDGLTGAQPHRHDAFGRHIPDDGTPSPAPIGWRSLFVLGLAGGLIPSTNALIILLAAINVDRPAYGLVLVVAFGLGMAVVLGGVGLALVLARDRLERWPAGSTIGRLSSYAPLGAACLIFVLGLWLTSQAIGVAPAF